MRHDTLAHRVRDRAASNPDRIAFEFLANGKDVERQLTWASLDRRAKNIASHLGHHANKKSHVLLALPCGLDFIECLFGCWYADMIPVPICLPNRKASMLRLQEIANDASPAVILCLDADFDGGQSASAKSLSEGVLRLTVTDCDSTPVHSFHAEHTGAGTDIALLQYTSGSTGNPKGVVLTHDNLIHNSELIARVFAVGTDDTFVSWLPLYHDMGLIGLVLQAAYSGSRTVLMPPERFLMHPIRWLQAIQRYRAVGTAAPNFGYELCVQRITAQQKAELDLSSLRHTLNGAETVRLTTMRRFEEAFEDCGFQRNSWYICYGLAEATLLVSGTASVRQSDTGVACCGHALGQHDIAIVDATTHQRQPSATVGEIWIRGRGCAQGYWRKVEASRQTFAARIVGESELWLRTGDLGYLDEGELYVTGRLKDLVIIAGRNHSPDDIEDTVLATTDGRTIATCAAFAIDEAEQEFLVVVVELDRRAFKAYQRDAATLDVDGLAREIKRRIAEEHGISAKTVAITKPGAIRRTTSGKITRSGCKADFLDTTLVTIT